MLITFALPAESRSWQKLDHRVDPSGMPITQQALLNVLKNETIPSQEIPYD
ncbi:MAG: hypothetical protein AAGC93_20210 [Cyanobacteria bacterium P01_F01_bin.53]